MRQPSTTEELSKCIYWLYPFFLSYSTPTQLLLNSYSAPTLLLLYLYSTPNLLLKCVRRYNYVLSTTMGFVVLGRVGKTNPATIATIATWRGPITEKKWVVGKKSPHHSTPREINSAEFSHKAFCMTTAHQNGKQRGSEERMFLFVPHRENREGPLKHTNILSPKAHQWQYYESLYGFSQRIKSERTRRSSNCQYSHLSLYLRTMDDPPFDVMVTSAISFRNMEGFPTTVGQWPPLVTYVSLYFLLFRADISIVSFSGFLLM